MAQHETPRRHRHRRPRENCRSQRGQPQEVFGTFQRRAYLGTRIAHVFHLLVAGKFLLQLGPQCLHLLRLARNHQAIRDTAAFLQQPGGSQVRSIHQHTRRKTGETDGLIDVLHDARRHRKVARTDTHLIPHLYIEPTQQALIHPYGAASRNTRCDMRRTIVDLDLPSQRIPHLHCLNLTQQHLLTVRHHAGKSTTLHHLQPVLICHLPIFWRKRTCGSNAQIRADQTLRLLLQRTIRAGCCEE